MSRKPYSTGETPEIGDQVRVTAAALDSFKTDLRKRMEGRIAVVRHFTYPSEDPMLTFPASGRKKEFKVMHVYAREVELVARAPASSDGAAGDGD